MVDSKKIITKPRIATTDEVRTAFEGSAAMSARLLNVATGLAVALDELRDQVNGLEISGPGCEGTSTSLLPESAHMGKLKQELAMLQAMFNPTRQQRRAFEREHAKGSG